MSRPLEGKIALVSGGSRGIGAAICGNLAKKGCSILFNYTSDSSASKSDDLVKELTSKHNIKAYSVRADFSKPEEPKKLVEAAIEHFAGGNKDKLVIDIIVNNAGTNSNLMIQDQTVKDFYNQYNINVLAPLMLVQAALPYLPHGTNDNPTPGRVINISSVSSSMGFGAQSVYGGTKAALESMTRTWSRELVGRATSNAVNPGPVSTDMWDSAIEDEGFKAAVEPWQKHTPGAQTGARAQESIKAGIGGRAGTPEEIAGVVGMLATPESSWCNSSVISANGGMAMTY